MASISSIIFVIFVALIFGFTLKLTLQGTIIDNLNKPRALTFPAIMRKNKMPRYTFLNDMFMWKMLLFYPLKFPFTEKERFYLGMNRNYITCLSTALHSRKPQKYYKRSNGQTVKIIWFDDDFAQFEDEEYYAAGYLSFLSGTTFLIPRAAKRRKLPLLSRYLERLVKWHRLLSW